MRALLVVLTAAASACAAPAHTTKSASTSFPVTTTVATGDVLSRYLRSRLTTHMEVCFGQNGWAAARLLEPSGVASFDRAVLADGERWQPEDAHAACRRVSVSYQPE